MSARDYTRQDLARIARLSEKPETRRAAALALEALDAVDIRLALDNGCATHEARQGDTVDVIASLGPAPKSEEAAS